MTEVTSPATNVTGAANEKSENLKNEIIHYISNENKAYFKSQQIGDPEIPLNEREDILKSILNDSHVKFLSRFGPYINPDHLCYFESQNYEHPEEKYEIEHYISALKLSHSKSDVNIRNRRYDAMQKLIKEGVYFSEVEMMRREPLLYEQLIGQYLTQHEVRSRDSSITSESFSFVNVLYDSLDRDELKELKKQQQIDEGDDESNCEPNLSSRPKFSIQQSEDDSEEEKFPKVPPEFKRQWGEFEDEADVKIKKQENKINFKYITASERELLREEFLSIMYSKFLSGYDKSFDYSKIDSNQEYDNLNLLEQDGEDKYFDSEEADESKEIPIHSSSTEDELELYMKNINEEILKSKHY